MINKMINKKLIHFEESADFESTINSNELLETSVVFVKSSNTIYTHQTPYQFVGWSKLTLEIPEGYDTLIGSDDIQILDSTGTEIYVLI